MNFVTAGNSIKQSKATGKGYHSNAGFKETLNIPHFHPKEIKVHGPVCFSEGREGVRESTFGRGTPKIT